MTGELTATPVRWLGAPAPGGLALPSARATPAQLYAPRGVFLDARWLAVADSGNHRVLLWRGLPGADGAPADVVLGQPSAWTEGPRGGGRGPENGLHLPAGLAIVEGRLLVADSWHHRILVWDEVPERSDTPPDWALGQPDLSSIEPNRGGTVSAAGLYWPYGLGFVDGRLYVADTGNRRVLAWNELPAHDRPADVVLGQPDMASAGENRGGPPSARSFRWPHAVAGARGRGATGESERLYVADAGNHRVLGWAGAPFRADGADRDADLVLGQSDFAANSELPHLPQTAATLRFPYGLASDGLALAVADTANNRILLWRRAPGPPGPPYAPADLVLGQEDFAHNGENRWRAVAHDTFCWPYGLHLDAGRLAVADSGNNRVMIWDVRSALAPRENRED